MCFSTSMQYVTVLSKITRCWRWTYKLCTHISAEEIYALLSRPGCFLIRNILKDSSVGVEITFNEECIDHNPHLFMSV